MSDDIVKEYDDAIDRASIAAITIRRATIRSQVQDERFIQAGNVEGVKRLADRLEAIVREFGLER